MYICGSLCKEVHKWLLILYVIYNDFLNYLFERIHKIYQLSGTHYWVPSTNITKNKIMKIMKTVLNSMWNFFENYQATF